MPTMTDYHFDREVAGRSGEQYVHVPLRPELEDAGFTVLYWPKSGGGVSTVYDHDGAEFRSVRRSFESLTEASDYFDGLEDSWWR